MTYCMRIFFLSLTVTFFVSISTRAQSSLSFTSEDLSYRNGLELLNEGKYVAASKSFEKYLNVGKDPLKQADA